MQEKTYYDSPIGCLEISASPNGICAVKKTDHHPINRSLPKNTHLLQCIEQLEAYFKHELTEFKLSIDWQEVDGFQKEVWEALLEIPYGRTCSYADIAEKLNNPKAVRAVGLANRNNPIAIIVPCHRVIGKSGKLTGYFYGLDTKRQLLELENPTSFARQGSLF